MQKIWRFPEDPIHLALGPAQCDESVGVLLVTTEAGKLWLIPLESNAAVRPAKRQKELSGPEWNIFEDLNMYEEPSIGSPEYASWASGRPGNLQIKLKRSSVPSYRSNSTNVKATPVKMEALLGVVPNSAIATFTTETLVLVFTKSSSIHRLNIVTQKCECVRPARNAEPSSVFFARITSNAFRKLFANASASPPPIYVLIEGGMDGNVYATAVNSMDEPMIPPVLVATTHQPVMALLSAQALPGSEEAFLIIGQNGLVLALSEKQAPDAAPFLRSTSEYVHVEGLDFRSWNINSPVTSAFAQGAQRIYYSAGSQILVSTPFEGSTLRETLDTRRVPVDDVVLKVSGKGLFSTSTGRNLVALTSRGKLLSVETSEHVLEGFDAEDDNSSKGWSAPQATIEQKIKEKLLSITASAKSLESVMQQDRAVSSAIHEVATALRLTSDITTGTVQPARGMHSRIVCTLEVEHTSPDVVPEENLRFGCRSPSLAPSSEKTTKLLITLENRGDFPVSGYWSVVVELRGTLGAKPLGQFSSPINHGCGISPNGRCVLEFDISCYIQTMEPFLASIYLCHVNDYHEILLKKSISSLEETPGGSCTMLAHYRIDVLHFLRPLERFRQPDQGTFSGNLIVRNEDCELKNVWKSLKLEHLLQRGTLTKDALEIRFSAPEDGSVTISCSNTTKVSFQASSFLLACLVREALLHHLLKNNLEVELVVAGTDKEEIKNEVKNLCNQLQEISTAYKICTSDNLAKFAHGMLNCYKKTRDISADSFGLVADPKEFN